MSTVFIYDDIGPDWLGMVSAKSIVDQLKQHEGTRVVLRINSPGGDVNEALAIYTAMRKHPVGVDVEIDGLAASAASYIAMAGESVRIAENAMLMIHDPWTIAVGQSDDLRKTADVLDKYGQNLADVYAARSGKSADDIRSIMKAETWYTAAEAKEAGLVDEIGTSLKVAARVMPGRYRNTPSSLLASEHRRAEARKVREFQMAAKVAMARAGRK